MVVILAIIFGLLLWAISAFLVGLVVFFIVNLFALAFGFAGITLLQGIAIALITELIGFFLNTLFK